MSMRAISTICALNLLLLLSPTARGESLDWDICAREASEANADLATAREKLRAAEYQEKAAFAGFFPDLSGVLSYDRSEGGGNAYALSLNASQNLFSGFRDRALLDKTSAERESVLATRDLIAARVSHDLKFAFSALSYAQEFVKLSDNIAKRRSDNLELVELRFQGGRENKGSYFLSKAALSQARFETLQAKNALDVGRQRLAQAIGRDQADDLHVSGEIPIVDEAPLPDYPKLVVQTPEYRQAVATERIGEAQLSLTHSQFYPTLDLSGSYGKEGQDWFPDNTRWNVGPESHDPLLQRRRRLLRV